MAGSASLQADALDFLGDAGNYAFSLFVVGMALRYRAMAALAKGATMGLFGLSVIGSQLGTQPKERYRALSRWAQWARSPCWRTLYRSDCCGPIGAGTPTCDRPGFARVTMYWAISLF